MQYVALIYSDESLDPADLPPIEAWFEFGKKHKERIGGGEALVPTTMATSVRIRDGKALIIDGPFAETREALGGFYLLECRDLDHAIALAKELPAASYGTIEVRPVMRFDT